MAQMERIARRLRFTTPFDGASAVAFLAARALAGVEEVDGSTYRRVFTLERGRGIAELTPGRASVGCVLWLEDGRDASEAVAACRRLLGLDADPSPPVAALEHDPVIGVLVRGRPGLRVPGSVDGFEIAIRAIVGQQVSVAGARTTLGRLVAAYGRPLSHPSGGLTHAFPEPAALAEAPSRELPMPRVRAAAIGLLARAVAAGELELGPGADRERSRARLLEIKGIGPWTASYVAMRALGDPDAFLPTDVGVLRRLRALGHEATPAEATRLAERWRPWRSYAVVQLWTKTYTLLGRRPEALRVADAGAARRPPAAEGLRAPRLPRGPSLDRQGALRQAPGLLRRRGDRDRRRLPAVRGLHARSLSRLEGGAVALAAARSVLGERELRGLVDRRHDPDRHVDAGEAQLIVDHRSRRAGDRDLRLPVLQRPAGTDDGRDPGRVDELASGQVDDERASGVGGRAIEHPAGRC